MTWRRYGKSAKTSSLDRQDFLLRNQEQLIKLMAQTDLPNPVGIVADLRDHHGRQLALATGWDDARIERELAEYKVMNRVPTLSVVLPFTEAERIMPNTSPTAKQTFTKVKEIMSVDPSRRLIIGIMGKGNSYAVV